MGKGPEMKKAMPFVQGLKKRLVFANEKPKDVFERKLNFNEVGILEDMKKGLVKQTGCREVVVVSVNEGNKSGLPPQAEVAVPGQPGFLFENVE